MSTCFRESVYKGEKFHFCSDHCKEIFDFEPEKYVQAYISSHQALQGNCAPEGVDPSAPGFNPAEYMLDFWRLDAAVQGDFNGSADQKNFAAWRELATTN